MLQRYWGVFVTGCLFLILILAEMVREQRVFRITDYEIFSQKLNQLKSEKRIVLLSDLHNHVYGKDNFSLLEAVRNAKPDLILIAGDMLVGQAGTFWGAAFDFVKQLPEICPVYYGNGNHEQRMKEHPEKYGDAFWNYKEQLLKCGIHFLENESVDFMADNCKIRISGLEIPEEFYHKFQKRQMDPEHVEECLGKPEKEAFQILIAHNPVYFQAYRRWGADLVLSGHLHGGLVRIPGIGGVISPQFRIFPKYCGELTREKDSWIAVSKGLGSHTINIRLFNPAEVVVLHLKACENKKNPV